MTDTSPFPYLHNEFTLRCTGYDEESQSLVYDLFRGNRRVADYRQYRQPIQFLFGEVIGNQSSVIGEDGRQP